MTETSKRPMDCFSDRYDLERKANCKRLQSEALKGKKAALHALREMGVTRWEREGKRVI
jgi:hypothetical protein